MIWRISPFEIFMGFDVEVNWVPLHEIVYGSQAMNPLNEDVGENATKD